MKRVLSFLLPILVITSTMFAGFGAYQANSVKKRLLDEIRSNAATLAESIDFSEPPRHYHFK